MESIGGIQGSKGTVEEVSILKSEEREIQTQIANGQKRRDSLV
jgi:hypothetical protein